MHPDLADRFIVATALEQHASLVMKGEVLRNALVEVSCQSDTAPSHLASACQSNA
jgi:PIN domain nuclease of toxin-antitoxin system